MRALLFALALLLPLQDPACGGCKAKLKPNAVFCAECGMKVPEKLCADCKKPLKPGAAFCPECGKKVEEPKPAPKPEPKPEPKPDPNPPVPVPAPVPVPSPDAGKPAAPPPAVDPDAVKEKRGEELEKHGVTADQINRAIDRGAAWLAGLFKGPRPMAGDDYLAAYALIHTPQYHTNAKLREKIIDLLRRDDWTKSGHVVYVGALRALCLEATKDPELKALAREVAEYLVEAQGENGTWSYRVDVPFTKVAPAPAEASGIAVSGGEPLDETPKGELVEKKGKGKGSEGDNSCTQFAILGLHAAARCGFSVPRGVWERCLRETEKRVSRDGGWLYHSGGNESYGSMTCAGICTMVICRSYLGEKSPVSDPKVQGGLAWLAANFSVSKNPKSQTWPMYYLYSVERVGVFCDTERIGPHAWYPMGAKHLVGAQKPDGRWDVGEGSHEHETSFALLFLTRATAPVRAVRRGGKGALETHALNESQNFLFILDASGSMMEEVDGKAKVDIAKEVVEAVVKKLPEGTHVGLRVYGHRFNALQKESETDSELLIPIAPLKLDQFIARLQAIRCRGKTPITHSLRQSIGDLSGVPADVELMTLLLTDGGESTRGAKPAEAARELTAARKGMKLDVVGFDINQDDWREQLEEVAAQGNGRYYHCKKSSDLLAALAGATTGASDYALLDKDGKELLKGKLGDRHVLPEGKYTFSVSLDGKKEDKTVWINTDVVSHVTVHLARFGAKKK
ncbi:MAG TPA: VWA domain-containing protein [Planctomycetota bacterium]